jgi:HD-GYP domain-containing protein (c-di-GMP phosphodiesterase class II)
MEKTVPLEDVKPGMMVAREIVNGQDGQVLIPKDAIVTTDDISKLKEHKAVRLDSEGPLREHGREHGKEHGKEEPPLYLSPEENHQFPNFKGVYDEMEARLKEQLTAIAEGGTATAESLSDLTRQVATTLPHKRSVFSYLNYMKRQKFYTFSHCINVSLLCMRFGQWLNLCREEMNNLVAAGMLHDIGMMRVPPDIITKTDRLTEEETLEIRKHPQHSFTMIFNLPVPDEVKLAVLQHHERIDGSGYPKGLTGPHISLMAKIISICDIYEAMILDRPYREMMCPFQVIKEFEQNYYSKLDTQYLMIFLGHIAYNYLDRNVRLSDGRTGRVVFINSNKLSAPIVQLAGGECKDLMFDKALSIEAVL